jgi:citrate lyase subunit beta / citryl-CoA lyase
MKPARLLRSVLFCPGDREKVLRKALTLNSDAVVIDLEDAVSQANKISARKQVEQFLQSSQTSKLCVVRINCPNTSGKLIMRY